MTRTVITFQTVRQVIKADQLLAEQQIISKIIPVPESISSECGMCIETTIENRETIQNILSQHQIAYQLFEI